MTQNPFMAETNQQRHGTVPILPTSSRTGVGCPPETLRGEPMDLTPPASTSMGPPNSSPEMDQTGGPVNGMYGDGLHAHGGPGVNGLSAAAATSSQQPKVVQTAFIHKLYKYACSNRRLSGRLTCRSMLEDSSIQNLISWSSNNESFVMSPSAEFSKVLA